MIVSLSVNMARHQRGSYIVTSMLSLEWPHQKKQSNSFVAVIHKQESRHMVPKSVLQAVLGRIQFTLHATRRTPHRASCLVQSVSAWLVKTRRAPSQHSRDARVYGHTTTAMHKLSTPPPCPPLPFPPCPLSLPVPLSFLFMSAFA